MLHLIRCVFLILGFILFTAVTQGQSLYKEQGKASFYAHKFNGRKTASGEIFSNSLMTAAHRTLPFGTIVKVINLRNQKSVVVRINDRGPFIHGRIIDLSLAAADSLGFRKSGWVEVLVEEIIIPPPPPPPLPPADDEPALAFPGAWLGDWSGELKMYTQSGFKNKIPMQLRIHPTPDPHRFTWQIVYDSVPRNYELVISDSAGRMFAIDEKNGIQIPAVYMGNQLITRFEVKGTLLDCTYERREDGNLHVHLRVSDDQHVWYTGGIEHAQDSIPGVKVYAVTVMHKAMLSKTH